MRINSNLASLNTYNKLSANQTGTNKSLEKLSSGMRINKAADDAAGLAISEKMRGQIRGLNQAARNSQDGISLIQTAEGALNETHSILQRMRELAVQGANGTLAPEDRTAIGTEMTELATEVERIGTSTKFNGTALLSGGFGLTQSGGTFAVAGNITGLDVSGAKVSTTYTLNSVANSTSVSLKDAAGNTQVITGLTATGYSGTLNFDKLGIKVTVNNASLNGDLDSETIITAASGSKSIQIGANDGDTLTMKIGDMTTAATGLDLGAARISTATSADSSTTITNIEAAISKVSTQRATLGAYQNRLEHTINNLATSAENLTASESRIRDVDMANEMMNFTKNNILSQAAQAMLAQANQQPQGVLQLLRG